MEIDYNKLWDLVTIACDNYKSVRLDGYEQRELLEWFLKNKPELVRGLTCKGGF